MIVIAHNIRSLHNVGSILRSADAFDVECVYLTGFTGFPPRAEIAKTALGAEDRVVWKQSSNVLDVIHDLRNRDYRVVALENGIHAEPIAPLGNKVALILGNEVEGIEKDILAVCDTAMEIPMPGRKRSLNVSVAAGIALFVLSQKTT
jgi:tRNA G18 (ribose-2'-O)-methylase SpoU